MRRFLLLGACLLSLNGLVQPVLGLDAFDRHTTFWLRQATMSAQPVSELTSGQAATWKTIGEGISSPCIVVRTNQGHWAKALISWGLRKGIDKAAKPTPVLLIDRFVTYDNDRPDLTLASGKDVMLFPGFQFNFEIGQVVPIGHGGDISFTEARRLIPAGEARLFGLNGSALPAKDPDDYDPTDHDDVRPRDFAGTWKVDADGRWRGTWQLVIDDEGMVQGSYISDESKSAYPVKGTISGLPHRLSLDMELANATQSFEAFLWTKDKSAMAGSTTLSDRKFGFYAIRLQDKN